MCGEIAGSGQIVHHAVNHGRNQVQMESVLDGIGSKEHPGVTGEKAVDDSILGVANHGRDDSVKSHFVAPLP